MSIFSLSSSRKDAGGKRSLKQRIGILLYKSKAKRIKRQGKKRREQLKKDPTRIPADTIPEKEPLTYSLGRSSGICRELKVVIFQKTNNRDTILVYFPDHRKNLSDEKKLELKNYVEKISSDSITGVTIKNCHKKDILTEHEIIWLEERARKISKYLRTLNVQKAKIKTED